MIVFKKHSLPLLLLATLVFQSGCAEIKNLLGGQKETKEKTFEEDLTKYRPQYQTEAAAGNPPASGATETPRDVAPTNDITARLDTALAKITEQNKSIRYAQGYRIQIYSGNSREDAYKARDRSYAVFPDITPNVVYTQPTFRVRIGNFINRLEAQRVYAGLKKDFPNAMVVPDRVEIK